MLGLIYNSMNSLPMINSKAPAPNADQKRLYQASVPVFQRYLNQLRQLLIKAQAETANTQQLGTLLNAALAPHMFNLTQQVTTAASFAVRTCYPLAGLAVPALADSPEDMESLLAWVRHCHTALEPLAPTDFDTARTIKTQAGDAQLSMPASEFLHLYAVPNFLFHLSMAYAILRREGIPLGKGDFDGFHRYAPDFHFV
jgi:uncharacterized protein